jgi:hypothetical protein
MTAGDQGTERSNRRAPLPIQEKRARRWRLLIIILVGVALLGGSFYVRQRQQSDLDAADASARAVAGQLTPQLSLVDLGVAFASISAAGVNGELPQEFPTLPQVDGATLTDASAMPNSVTLTYRLTSHGIDRCVIGSYSPASGASTQVADCALR